MCFSCAEPNVNEQNNWSGSLALGSAHEKSDVRARPKVLKISVIGDDCITKLSHDLS